MKYFMPCGCSFNINEDLLKKWGKPLTYYMETGKIPPVIIDYNNLPDCKLVWEMLGQGYCKGVFQLESGLGRTYSKKLKPETIEHLSALGSILRPGSLEAKDSKGVSVTDHYCLRKNGLEPVEYPDKCLEGILKDTYGLMIFQESCLSVAKKVAGFNLLQADALRKCVTADTMFVSKIRGWISINKLLETGYENELFLTMDEEGVQSWEEIEKIWLTGRQDVRTVESNSGFKVKATGHHQFLTNNGWKARLRLKEKEDYLISVREADFDGEDRISLDLAMVLAGMICEGYFVEKHSTFTNFDKKTMNLFERHFKKVFNRDKTNNDPKVFILRREEIRFLSNYMEYGLSEIKKIPDIMMGMTKETTRHFLSFMLGCEGGVSEAGQFDFSSKSEAMVDRVKLLLLRFGIYSNKDYRDIPDYGRHYRLYINECCHQKKVLELLSHHWPDYKIESLKRIIDNKNINSFTTDIITTNIVQKLINQYPKVFNYKSGHFHLHNVSMNNFKKFCIESGDKKWIKFSGGMFRLDLLESVEKKLPLWKQVKVYDFSMKNKDKPFIVANGLVIHNSMGKKIPEEMAKSKIQFLEGAKKTGIISDDKANDIFKDIEASQRYSFNRCLSPFTHIELNGKQSFIKNAKVGDRVSTPYGYSKILRVYHNGKKTTYCISFKNGELIRCTVDHKLQVSTGELIKVSDILSLGLKVVTKNGNTEINSILEPCVEDTIDIEIEHSQHIFWANNISVSNSHSYGYALNGFSTAFAKIHFPTQFFCSYLRHSGDSLDPYEEVEQLINEAKIFGIKIYCPNLEHLKKHFHLSDNTSIRFGIVDIRGIGESQFGKLKELEKQSISKYGKKLGELEWNQFLYLSDDLSKTVVENLISSGAADCYVK